MPLQGKAKKDYQRSYMREYMRRKRASVKTSTSKTPDDVKTKELSYERDEYAQE